MNTSFEKLSEAGGWVGMCLIHGATLPVTISLILGWSNHYPPISMILLVWTGLALFFLRALARRDRLYLVSNGVGFAFQSVLLGLIVSEMTK